MVAAVSLAYACCLLVFARHKGERFFLPGFAAGAIVFLLLFVGLHYGRAAFAGVTTRTSDVTRAVMWTGPAGIIGSWFAARSVLKRLRRQRSLDLRPGAILRIVGAFMGGLALVVLVQLAALVAQPPVARTPLPSVEIPAAPVSEQKKAP